MSKKFCFALCLGLLIGHGAAAQRGRGAAGQPQTVTLYSPNKYGHDQSRALFSFGRGELARRGEGWDLAYGTLYVGDELDWLDTAGPAGSRTRIRDLGEHAWGDEFRVPAVEPLPKLKPGERRAIMVDASGAPGRGGAPGANGGPGDIEGPDWQREAAEARDVVREPAGHLPPPLPRPPPSREPRVSPVFVKARAGHMYVIHVVNDESDYYALFRVEALERGDHCTISWKLVPAPAPPTARGIR